MKALPTVGLPTVGLPAVESGVPVDCPMSAGLVKRARIMLLAANGVGTNEIAVRIEAFKPAVIAQK